MMNEHQSIIQVENRKDIMKMHYVERLPIILGALASLITGLISYEAGYSQQILYLRMAVSMVLFFFIGLLVRSTIMSIINGTAEKEEEGEKEKEEMTAGEKVSNAEITPKTDRRIENDEDFDPLKVSDIIKESLKSK